VGFAVRGQDVPQGGSGGGVAGCVRMKRMCFLAALSPNRKGAGWHFWSTVDIATRKNDTEYDTFSKLDKCI
jgi:hypothetical protein